MKKLSLGLLTLSLAFLVGCSSGKKVQEAHIDESKPIIKVNEEVITENMFNDMMESAVNSSFLAQKNIDINAPQNKLIYLVFKDRVLNELIIKELLELEIQKRNIEVSDKEVDKAIDEMAKQLGGKSKLEATLTLNNVDKDKFKDTIKRDLSLKKLIDTLAITKVSKGDVKKFYDKNKEEKFTNPDMVRAQHILISASEDDIKTRIKSTYSDLSEAQVDAKVKEELSSLKAKAEKVLKQAKANSEEFGKLAKKYSEDYSSAKNDGDLGFFNKNEMVKEFSEAAFSLKPDTISDVIKTDYGYHIIKVTDRKKAGVTPFEEVKGEIEKYLTEQNKVVVLQKFVDGLKNTAKITYEDTDYDPAKIQEEIKQLAKEQKAPVGAEKSHK